MGKRIRTKGTGSTTTSTVIGISLLLFLLGIFAYVLIISNGVAERSKQQLEVDVIFREIASEADILKMEKELSSRPYILNAKYISKDSAKALTMKLMGDETFDILGDDNPMPPSIAVQLSSEYVNADSAKSFKTQLMNGNEYIIEDVAYNESQLLEINNVFTNLKYWVISIGLLLLFVAMALINNTIRLAVYSKRFTIKTMQLVGAKPSFIRRPFLLNSIGQGFISGVIAVCLLILFAYFFKDFDPGAIARISASEDQLHQELIVFIWLFGGIVFLGIFISWISTFFALSKYIWIKTEKLY